MSNIEPESDSVKRPQMPRAIKWSVTTASSGLLLVKMLSAPSTAARIDLIALGLVGLAAFPWIFPYTRSGKLGPLEWNNDPYTAPDDVADAEKAAQKAEIAEESAEAQQSLTGGDAKAVYWQVVDEMKQYEDAVVAALPAHEFTGISREVAVRGRVGRPLKIDAKAHRKGQTFLIEIVRTQQPRNVIEVAARLADRIDAVRATSDERPLGLIITSLDEESILRVQSQLPSTIRFVRFDPDDGSFKWL